MYDLKYFNDFWAGLLAIFMGLTWILVFINKANEEETDIFKEEKK
jgi:hypothetical protein